MIDIVAAIFEIFGMISADLGDHLRGLNLDCNDYTESSLYNTIGWTILISVFVVQVLYYWVIDSEKYSGRWSWALLGIVLSLLVGGGATYMLILSISENMYCPDLILKPFDPYGFGITVFIVTFLFYTLLSVSPFPRKMGDNCVRTPFRQ